MKKFVGFSVLLLTSCISDAGFTGSTGPIPCPFPFLEKNEYGYCVCKDDSLVYNVNTQECVEPEGESESGMSGPGMSDLPQGHDTGMSGDGDGDGDDDGATTSGTTTTTTTAGDGDEDDPPCDLDVWYADCDDDGYAPPGAQSTQICGYPQGSPNGCPGGEWTGLSPANSSDCDDDNSDVYPGASEGIANGIDEDCNGQELCYRDNDNDGYRTDEVVASFNTSCALGGVALSNAPLEWADPGAKNVCCDMNADVHTGQQEWFSIFDDPDGNDVCPGGRVWDYDCDGLEEKRWTTNAQSCSWCGNGCCWDAPSGWWVPVPSCGSPPMTWSSNCQGNGAFSCSFAFSMRAQDCH